MAETEILGLREFQAALRKMNGEWDSAMSLAHQRIGSKGAAFARARARAGSRLQAKAASAIGERHTVRNAAVAVLPSRLDRMANVAYWGAKKRTGWYSKRRYEGSTRQHPVWIGNSWEVAQAGQGPYAINAALAEHREELLDEYLEQVDRIARAAFPERI